MRGKKIATIPVPEIRVPNYTAEHPDAEGNYYGPHTGTQGGCFDGTYFYQSFLKYCYNRNEAFASSFYVNNAKCIVRVVKYDIIADEVVCVSEEMDVLNHINDITYHPGKGQLIACNNRGNKNVISFLNADTLTYEGKQILDYELYAISYHAYSDQYVLGISGTYKVVITDNCFKEQSFFYIDRELVANYTKQNICCDDNYIYCLFSGKKGVADYAIFVYDWEGQFVRSIKVDSEGEEPENASIYDGALYVCIGKKIQKITL